MATISYDVPRARVPDRATVRDMSRRLLAATLVLLPGLLASGCGAPGDGSRSGTATASPSAPSATPAPSATSTTPAPSTPTPRATPTTPPTPARETTTTATARQLAGLVRIVATVGDGGETSTGMLLSSTGEVLTNRHGVAGASAVEVTVMSTGRTYAARVAASSRARDVALLRLVGATGLPTVTLAARDAAVGDPVTVVGDARGRRTTFTAATGTVLATGQTLVTPDTLTAPAERLTGVVLSSSDVVLGVSGGPTYDAAGRVVGMTTAAVRTPRGPAGVAIPVEALRRALVDLRREAGPPPG